MARVFIGLGSNLGDKKKNLALARRHLVSEQTISEIAASSIAITAPVEFTKQPYFANQIIIIETTLSPRDLLQMLLVVEQVMGRVRATPKGPRIIDLDILLYGGTVTNEPDLKIPHPAIIERIFILEHLIELDPELRDPVTGIRYKDILSQRRGHDNIHKKHQ